MLTLTIQKQFDKNDWNQFDFDKNSGLFVLSLSDCLWKPKG